MWTALIVYCLACYAAVFVGLRKLPKECVARGETPPADFYGLWLLLAPLTFPAGCIYVFCQALGRLITRGK